MKPKVCKVCHDRFIPTRPMQTACGPLCAVHIGAKRALKAERARTRELKQKVKTRSDWLREAQTEFNKFIRLRDKDQPCISCGRHHQGQYHASHYRSVKACPELRFHEWNVNKACSACNTHLSGNIVEYRIALVEKIGADAVAWLEGPHQLQRLTIDDIREIKFRYSKKAKELE